MQATNSDIQTPGGGPDLSVQEAGDKGLKKPSGADREYGRFSPWLAAKEGAFLSVGRANLVVDCHPPPLPGRMRMPGIGKREGGDVAAGFPIKNVEIFHQDSQLGMVQPDASAEAFLGGTGERNG